MRLAVYCDFSYRVQADHVYAELPFALFLQGLAPHCRRLVLTGRLDPAPGTFPYRTHGVDYVPLPYYASGANVGEVLRALPRGIRRFWRLLDDVDVVWVLGPNPPQAVAFALLAILRRRRVVLGIRQNFPQLVRHKYPGRRSLRWAALGLEGAFRLLARSIPIVVVGPDLAHRYRGASSVHNAYVSLVADRDIAGPEADDRDYGGPELRILSVGRLDPEKNPLLLADTLARALRADPRWRMDICGDGSMHDALLERVEQLGVADRARILGHVPIDGGLWDLYRGSHALLHVSFTEGIPQVLLEALAARIPVVATAVGGVPELLRDCGLLVAVDDADAAASALGRLAGDPELRAHLVERGTEIVKLHTIETECARLAVFLAGPSAAGSRLPA